MEAVLNELTSPKVARVRNFEPAFGLTENLIATHATIYAKIAWRHGYEVEVDSPWVPKEWLPIAPVASYEDPWPFMQSFDSISPLTVIGLPGRQRKPLIAEMIEVDLSEAAQDMNNVEVSFDFSSIDRHLISESSRSSSEGAKTREVENRLQSRL